MNFEDYEGRKSKAKRWRILFEAHSLAVFQLYGTQSYVLDAGSLT